LFLRAGGTPVLRFTDLPSDTRQTHLVLDRVCVSRNYKLAPDRPLDIGSLGEALLFYGEVRLIADAGVIKQLIRESDPRALVALLSEKYLKITYMDGGFGIATNSAGTPFERHTPMSFRSESVSFDAVVDEAFASRTGSEGKGKKLKTSHQPLR
jgi:hypothetical protein